MDKVVVAVTSSAKVLWFHSNSSHDSQAVNVFLFVQSKTPQTHASPLACLFQIIPFYKSPADILWFAGDDDHNFDSALYARMAAELVSYFV